MTAHSLNAGVAHAAQATDRRGAIARRHRDVRQRPSVDARPGGGLARCAVAREPRGRLAARFAAPARRIAPPAPDTSHGPAIGGRTAGARSVSGWAAVTASPGRWRPRGPRTASRASRAPTAALADRIAGRAAGPRSRSTSAARDRRRATSTPTAGSPTCVAAVRLLVERTASTECLRHRLRRRRHVRGVRAADDDLVSGVAAVVGTPLRMGEWAQHPARLLEHARRVGMIRHPSSRRTRSRGDACGRSLDAPACASAWRRGRCSCCTGPTTRSCRTADARSLADAGRPERRSCGWCTPPASRLRHDPRAVATLLGWLERCVKLSRRRRPWERAAVRRSPALRRARRRASRSSVDLRLPTRSRRTASARSPTSAGTSTGRTSRGSTTSSRRLAARASSRVGDVAHAPPRPEHTL